MWKRWLVGLVLAVASGCSSDGDGGGAVKAPNADLQQKCDAYCKQLLSAELSGCARTEGASVSGCQNYCYGHVSYDVEGVVKCGALAASCSDFNDCGELTK
jgi:hypothetical protein